MSPSRNLPPGQSDAGGFTAATAKVESLWYDFSGIPNCTAKAVGKVVIPEPSSRLIQEFMDEMRAIGSEATGEEAKSAKGVVNQFAVADPDALENFSGRLIAAVSKVCQGSPSIEELDALPWRYQLGFFGYVGGGFLDPKISESRYEALAGSHEERVVHYLVRSHLNYGPDDWDSLPWYHQRSLLEELVDDMERENAEKREFLRAIGKAAQGFEVRDDPRPSLTAATEPSGTAKLRELGFRVVKG